MEHQDGRIFMLMEFGYLEVLWDLWAFKPHGWQQRSFLRVRRILDSVALTYNIGQSFANRFANPVLG